MRGYERSDLQNKFRKEVERAGFEIVDSDSLYAPWLSFDISMDLSFRDTYNVEIELSVRLQQARAVVSAVDSKALRRGEVAGISIRPKDFTVWDFSAGVYAEPQNMDELKAEAETIIRRLLPSLVRAINKSKEYENR